MGISYTGFADEAASGIREQVDATRQLGWSSIESRNIDGTNLTDIDDGKFEDVCQVVDEAGIRIDCFGSSVANWGKDVRKEDDFRRSVEELSRALPRMKRLGTCMIRAMSYGIVKNVPPEDRELEKLVISRVEPLVRMCEDAGVLYLHENCMNWGGQSWEHTLRLVEAIKSPAFGLIFDTGNPAFSFDRRGKEPWRLQSSWEFYQRVKPFIKHVHIKDCEYLGPSEAIFPKVRFTLPGKGNGDVVRILKDLVESDYDGFLSIEPHLEIVFHEGAGTSLEEARMRSYVNYGQQLMALGRDAGSQV